MPWSKYAHRAVSTNNISKFTAKKKRKRTANTTKIRYQRPTAHNQRSQIMRNARTISKMYKAVMTKRVWCDYQLLGTLFATLDAGNYTTSWGAWALTDFSNWSAVLRQDSNVDESSSTFLKRLSLNLRYSLNNSSWAQYNVWIVTPRKDAANLDPVASINAGQPPVIGDDFIEGPNGFNMRLNSAKFKVHFASYRTLTETTLFQNALPLAPAGNPSTTWSKGAANLHPNCNYRLPATSAPWSTLPYMQQPYYSRYILLVSVVQNAPQQAQPQTGARFDFDQLATTVNMT